MHQCGASFAPIRCIERQKAPDRRLPFTQRPPRIGCDRATGAGLRRGDTPAQRRSRSPGWLRKSFDASILACQLLISGAPDYLRSTMAAVGCPEIVFITTPKEYT